MEILLRRNGVAVNGPVVYVKGYELTIGHYNGGWTQPKSGQQIADELAAVGIVARVERRFFTPRYADAFVKAPPGDEDYSRDGWVPRAQTGTEDVLVVE